MAAKACRGKITPALRIILARRAGFCFGVKRAVDIAFETAAEHKEGIYTFGPLIHNPQVIEKLEENGVKAIKGLAGLGRKKVSKVIIRTHGVTEKEMERLSGTGYDIIDATCPFVKKAQQYAKLLKEEGYNVVILGDRHHPEVRGLMSYAGRGVRVVDSLDDFSSIRGRVGIVVQTTQQVSTLKRLLAEIVENTKEIKVYNTICNSTALRLKETEEIARLADVMVIVGGKNSANTTQLASLCSDMSVHTYHIETSDEIRDSWFKGADKVGITAGASTPDWIISEVIERIRDTNRQKQARRKA